jgi:hypothetical protein
MLNSNEMKEQTKGFYFKIDKYVNRILSECQIVAKLGETKREFKSRETGGFGYNLETNEFQKEIISKLESLGYKAYHDVEFKTLADCFLVVDWSE